MPTGPLVDSRSPGLLSARETHQSPRPGLLHGDLVRFHHSGHTRLTLPEAWPAVKTGTRRNPRCGQGTQSKRSASSLSRCHAIRGRPFQCRHFAPIGKAPMEFRAIVSCTRRGTVIVNDRPTGAIGRTRGVSRSRRPFHRRSGYVRETGPGPGCRSMFQRERMRSDRPHGMSPRLQN